jgi:hypothetical protein
MSKIEEYRASLSRLDAAAWPAYLTEHSGLPGPRGNIELGQAVADVGEPATFDALIGTDDEYPRSVASSDSEGLRRPEATR